ncbi:hypothetical protein K469DRAFT_781732, partial [Zopfia rhizophila CBS 207.26]
LRDANMLARKVSNARISVFQYERQGFGRGAIDQRLELLYHFRRSRGVSWTSVSLLLPLPVGSFGLWSECKMPIIFHCHCLGGIVIERALITAWLRQNDFRNVFPWVAGCVFLGTPFHVTKMQSKAMVLAEAAEKVWFGRGLWFIAATGAGFRHFTSDAG